MRDAEADHRGDHEFRLQRLPERGRQPCPQGAKLSRLCVVEIGEIRNVPVALDDQVTDTSHPIVSGRSVPDPEQRRASDELALQRTLANVLLADDAVSHEAYKVMHLS